MRWEVQAVCDAMGESGGPGRVREKEERDKLMQVWAIIDVHKSMS